MTEKKPSTCRATLFRWKFWSMFRVHFHLAWSTSSATETFVAGRRNAALRLVDLTECEQICCAPGCEFDEKRATKPKFVARSRSALYFSQQLFWTIYYYHLNFTFLKVTNPLIAKLIWAGCTITFLQLSSTRSKCFCCATSWAHGEKRETSIKTYNETMLRDKLRVFVSRKQNRAHRHPIHFMSMSSLCTVPATGLFTKAPQHVLHSVCRIL